MPAHCTIYLSTPSFLPPTLPPSSFLLFSFLPSFLLSFLLFFLPSCLPPFSFLFPSFFLSPFLLPSLLLYFFLPPVLLSFFFLPSFFPSFHPSSFGFCAVIIFRGVYRRLGCQNWSWAPHMQNLFSFSFWFEFGLLFPSPMFTPCRFCHCCLGYGHLGCSHGPWYRDSPGPRHHCLQHTPVHPQNVGRVFLIVWC